MRVPVKPELLRWARERAGLSRQDVIARFAKFEAWESGDVQPTLKQLEAFAKKTHAPIGYFFSAEPPVEKLPIPDFRTMDSVALRRASPDLLDTLYICLERQDWYRDFARLNREEPKPFVGSVSIDARPDVVAGCIRSTLRLGIEARASPPTWEEALKDFVSKAEDAGVLVMCSGIVGNNTHRVLDPEEFRGFALADDLAPLVFINWRGTKAARMFTLAHELAHLWLGQSALSNALLTENRANATELWCNQVAAEVLLPLELDRLDADSRSSKGGSCYMPQPYRFSKRFATSLIASTLNGQTLYTDAFRLLRIKKTKTLHDLGDSLGLARHLPMGADRN